jgi:hypothetical protein
MATAEHGQCNKQPSAMWLHQRSQVCVNMARAAIQSASEGPATSKKQQKREVPIANAKNSKHTQPKKKKKYVPFANSNN